MFRTNLIAAAAVTMIAAAAPTATFAVEAFEAATVAPAPAGITPQPQLAGEFWNGSRWNGVFTDETALSDDAVDALLAAIEPIKAAGSA